jgi:WD40 repeat protein
VRYTPVRCTPTRRTRPPPLFQQPSPSLFLLLFHGPAPAPTMPQAPLGKLHLLPAGPLIHPPPFPTDTTWPVKETPQRGRRVPGAHSGAWAHWALEGHTKEVISIAFSPDGQKIVSGSGDSIVCVWAYKPVRSGLEPARSGTLPLIQHILLRCS